MLCESLHLPLLPSPSSTCLPNNRPIIRRWGVESRNSKFVWKAWHQRRWQTRVYTVPFHQGLDASFFYRIEGGRRWGSKVKKAIHLTKWFGQNWGEDVSISFFQQSFTGGQGQGISLWTEQRHFSLTFRQRDRIPWGRPLCLLVAIDWL